MRTFRIYPIIPLVRYLLVFACKFRNFNKLKWTQVTNNDAATKCRKYSAYEFASQKVAPATSTFNFDGFRSNFALYEQWIFLIGHTVCVLFYRLSLFNVYCYWKWMFIAIECECCQAERCFKSSSRLIGRFYDFCQSNVTLFMS